MLEIVSLNPHTKNTHEEETLLVNILKSTLVLESRLTLSGGAEAE